jgi:hypothetical protein
MPAPAIQLIGLRGEIDPRAAARKELQLRVGGATVRVSEAAARRVIPPEMPVTVERIAGGRIYVRANAMGLLEGALEITLRSVNGRALRAEVVAARAGLFPIPLFAVAAAMPILLRKVLEMPGVHLGPGASVDVDLNAFTTPHGIHLPPLRSVTAEGGVLEVAF